MSNEVYLTDEEYKNYYPQLNGLRSRIAGDLPIGSGMRVLDVATGYGYFAIEVSKLDPSLSVIGIDISKNDVENAKRNVERLGLSGRVEILEMDATDMRFPDSTFDLAVNFLGLEDVHMTRGKKGVQRTFQETSRVLKPGGRFFFVIMPPEEMETAAQKLEVSVFSYICDATWLNSRNYERMVEDAGFRLAGKKIYHTGKKLTPGQAKEEIRFACENVPRIYGVSTPSFTEVWSRFGREIEENGLGHYSKVVVMAAQKL